MSVDGIKSTGSQARAASGTDQHRDLPTVGDRLRDSSGSSALYEQRGSRSDSVGRSSSARASSSQAPYRQTGLGLFELGLFAAGIIGLAIYLADGLM